MPPSEQERNPRKKGSMGPVIGFIVLVLLLGGGYYAWATFLNSEPAEETPQQPIVETTPPQETQYASTTMKFSLRYPQGFIVNEQYQYTRVSAAKPISGVQFRVPASFTEGTNLAPDSGVSMEVLPRANNCTGDIYLKANVKAQTVPQGALTLSVATSSETVGGETFEEAVFAVASSSPCIAMRYFIHTTAPATTSATGTAPTRMFDRTAIVALFDQIRQSLNVQ